MPLSFHQDRDEMYRQQRMNAEKYVLPFIESLFDLKGKHVLEIGCGEGGVLEPFLNRGCTVSGIDVNPSKIEFADDHFRQAIRSGKAFFIASDIYENTIQRRLQNRIDVILLVNTIEHIPNQEKLMMMIRDLVKDDGVVFISFPPWFMPYGGHQQMSDSRLGKLPYYHLLPRSLYCRLLYLFEKNEKRIQGLMEIVDTKLTIHGFEKLIKKCRYKKVKRRFYLINPIYEVKFGLRTVEQLPFIRSIPWIRDFMTTTCYYLLRP
jgi:SAM-dependent methyltransferase